MSGSISSLVRKGLTDAVAELGEFADVKVSYAYLFGATDRERLFTSRPRAQTPPAALKSGRNHRDETCRFDVVILVEGPGQSSYETDERASELGTVFEEWLADNKAGEALAITGLNWIRQDAWELNNLVNDMGSLTELTYTVVYNARLT